LWRKYQLLTLRPQTSCLWPQNCLTGMSVDVDRQEVPQMNIKWDYYSLVFSRKSWWRIFESREPVVNRLGREAATETKHNLFNLSIFLRIQSGMKGK
jgi:hypothetical protein